MSSFYLLNNVQVGTQRLYAGTLVNDAVENAAAIRNAGGVLWPSTDVKVAAAAAIAQALRRSGGLAVEEGVASELMQSAAQAGSMVQKVDLTLVAGTLTVNTGITVTATSAFVPYLRTPGAGVSGTRYKITSPVVGGPGTGAFTVTAVDSAAGDNIVATDVSLLTVVIIG